MGTRTSGLLVGWRRGEAEHCMMLALQIMEAKRTAEENGLRVFEMAIGDQQLCSLIRDLSRAARERNLVIWPKKKRKGLLTMLMKPLMVPKPGGAGRKPELLLLPDFTVEPAPQARAESAPSNENVVTPIRATA